MASRRSKGVKAYAEVAWEASKESQEQEKGFVEMVKVAASLATASSICAGERSKLHLCVGKFNMYVSKLHMCVGKLQVQRSASEH
mmetsp:Transcript_23601/g.42651  ORF Transcript_23601/g.42651 Transcript_23601/m.42651 type:complete len:85 (+) Transcript_23601:988-1242(+)